MVASNRKRANAIIDRRQRLHNNSDRCVQDTKSNHQSSLMQRNIPIVCKTLLISDDARRAIKLASALDPSAQVEIYDLYSKHMPPKFFGFIIVDVDSLDSRALMRLVSILKKVRGREVPLLFLAHGNSAQARTQAVVIDATKTVSAATAFQTLRDTVDEMRQLRASPASSVVRLAAEAREFLLEIFFSGATITPELAATGSELIAHAVAESGVRSWVSAVQQFDNATHQHCLLVAGLGAAFASKLGLGRMESFRMTKAALLHDVGKTQIPVSILNKPGPLTADEMAVMRTHAAKGYEMLKGSDFPDETLLVVRSHHELLDGSGYPDRLREAQIPDLVRLVTVCDIFGALVERRSYKSPMSVPRAYSIIAGMTGRLDQNLVAAFRFVTESMV